MKHQLSVLEFAELPTIDLHGKRGHEVEALLDEAVSEALVSSAAYLRIIQGRGEGIVAKAVAAYAAHHANRIALHHARGNAAGAIVYFELI
jgi:DNA-nicking Smr family endonuclease